MKLWMGEILDASIADAFRESRNEVERAINVKIEAEEYGSGITSWDVVLVVLESR